MQQTLLTILMVLSGIYIIGGCYLDIKRSISRYLQAKKARNVSVIDSNVFRVFGGIRNERLNLSDVLAINRGKKVKIAIALSWAQQARVLLRMHGYDIISQVEDMTDGDSPQAVITAQRGFLQGLHGNIEGNGEVDAVEKSTAHDYHGDSVDGVPEIVRYQARLLGCQRSDMFLHDAIVDQLRNEQYGNESGKSREDNTHVVNVEFGGKRPIDGYTAKNDVQHNG